MIHGSFFKRPLFLILIIYTIILAIFLKSPSPKAGDIALRSGGNISVTGVVLSYPRLKGASQSFVLSLHTFNDVQTKAKVQVYCNNCPKIGRGQTLQLQGMVKPTTGPGNFGSFNWPSYQARRHIFNDFICHADMSVTGKSFFWGAASSVRNSILDVFNNHFAAPLNLILSGIVLGEKGPVPSELYGAFQDSGAMHLLVASGSNVGFVTLVVYFLCAFLGLGRIASAVLAVFFAGFYTVIAGADAPLLRAFIMTFFATIGFVLGRKSGGLQGFVLAALLILIINPQSLYAVGFQMSFLATLGIILFAACFRLPQKINKFGKAVLGLTLVSLTAQLALLPIFTNYFYKVSLIAVVSNIVLIPLSGIIMGGGFVLWLCSFIPLDIIFYTVKILLQWSLILFNFFVNFFAALPGAKTITPALSSTTILAYYIILLSIFLMQIFKHRKLVVSVSFGLAIIAFAAGCFIKQDAVHILSGRYNMAVLVKEGKSIKIIGGGIDGDIISKAVLASGSTKVACMFLSGNNKSAAYAFGELKDIKVANLYLPYGDIPPVLDIYLVANPAVKTDFLWAGQQPVCSVVALAPWYLDKQNNPIVKDGGQGLSYQIGDISTAANLKAIKIAGNFIKQPA